MSGMTTIDYIGYFAAFALLGFCLLPAAVELLHLMQEWWRRQ